jgi:hypothetical protein
MAEMSACIKGFMDEDEGRWRRMEGRVKSVLGGCLIRRLNCSADADPAMARSWYEVAAQFGSADARQRLDRLGRDQAGGDLLSRR